MSATDLWSQVLHPLWGLAPPAAVFYGQSECCQGSKRAVIEVASVCVVESSMFRPVQMLAQKVETSTGDELITFWDSWS
jgi:hypothetical protein